MADPYAPHFFFTRGGLTPMYLIIFSSAPYVHVPHFVFVRGGLTPMCLIFFCRLRRADPYVPQLFFRPRRADHYEPHSFFDCGGLTLMYLSLFSPQGANPYVPHFFFHPWQADPLCTFNVTLAFVT